MNTRTGQTIQRAKGNLHQRALHVDEGRLVQKALVQGDRAAYAELVNLYADSIFRIAARFASRPEAVNDLAEEIFVRAWDRFDQWESVSNFRTWLFRVAVETCLDQASGPGHSLAPTDYAIDDLKTSKEQSATEVALNRDELVSVYAALDLVPPVMRAVVVLRALEDCSYEELSTIMRQPISTIDTWMRHGIAAMRRPLEAF